MTVAAGLFETTLGLRRRQRLKRLWIWAGVLAVIAWCANATIVAETDWSRLGGGLGVFRGIARFFSINFDLVPLLIEPAIETLMMATLGTLLGCIFALPVAWFGALNVTPNRFIAYPIGRFLMVLSRS